MRFIIYDLNVGDFLFSSFSGKVDKSCESTFGWLKMIWFCENEITMEGGKEVIMIKGRSKLRFIFYRPTCHN